MLDVLKSNKYKNFTTEEQAKQPCAVEQVERTFAD